MAEDHGQEADSDDGGGMSVPTYDFPSMLVHILESGVSVRQLADRMEAEYVDGKMLQHYLRGGVPNFPRGDAILTLWCEATGLSALEAPRLNWTPGYRKATNTTHALRPRCPECQQIIRGRALQVWEQKQLFAAGQVTPSWLGGKPVQHTEFQGAQRSIRLSDNEPGAAT